MNRLESNMSFLRIILLKNTFWRFPFFLFLINVSRVCHCQDTLSIFDKLDLPIRVLHDDNAFVLVSSIGELSGLELEIPDELKQKTFSKPIPKRRMSVRAWLKVVLQQSGYDFVVKNERIVILRNEEMEKIGNFSEVHSLWALDKIGTDAWPNAITSVVKPEQWKQNGGNAMINIVQDRRLAIVTCSREMHAQIEDLTQVIRSLSVAYGREKLEEMTRNSEKPR